MINSTTGNITELHTLGNVELWVVGLIGKSPKDDCFLLKDCPSRGQGGSFRGVNRRHSQWIARSLYNYHEQAASYLCHCQTTKEITHVIGVPPKLHHSPKYQQADTITNEAKGCTATGLLSPHLWCKPLVGGKAEPTRGDLTQQFYEVTFMLPMYTPSRTITDLCLGFSTVAHLQFRRCLHKDDNKFFDGDGFMSMSGSIEKKFSN